MSLASRDGWKQGMITKSSLVTSPHVFRYKNQDERLKYTFNSNYAFTARKTGNPDGTNPTVQPGLFVELSKK